MESTFGSPKPCSDLFLSGSQAKLTTRLVNGDRLGWRAGPLYCEGIGCTRAVWPDQDPLDKRWKLTGFERTVVGVVKNSGANVLTDGDSIEAYVPVEGPDLDWGALILHTPGDPAPLVRNHSEFSRRGQ